jgi:hypothetical protein
MSTREMVFYIGSLLFFFSTSCGDASVCEQACNKQKQCAEALKCSTTDPLGSSSCAQTKSYLTGLDCDKLSLPGACSGDVLTAYQAIQNCYLNPTSCICSQ